MPALVQASVFQLPVWIIWLSASPPPMRSSRYVQRCIDGHLSLPAMASGAMPAALSFATSARSSSQVVGGRA